MECLKEFLTKQFPADKLGEMTIDKYTGTGNKDGFTYWVERKLDAFGGIKAGRAYKFGIYKFNQKPDDSYAQDNQYAWVKRYGTRRGRCQS